MANLETKLGRTVVAVIDGHSALDGALIPEGSTVELTSNTPAVATVPATVAVPAGGAQTLSAPVTLVAAGSADLHVKVTTPDAQVFEDTANLLVDPLPVPGLVRVSITPTEQPAA